MDGPDNKPLLLLSREGEGRVALLLSDHIWLWARGYEGGGPHLDLLRRLSHWLMKQPDLEEEALRLFVRGRDLTVQRQTMADTVERGDADDAVGQDPHAHAHRRPIPACGARPSRRTSSGCGARPTASSPRWSMSARPIRASSPRSPRPPRCWRRSPTRPAATSMRIADGDRRASCRASSRCARATPTRATTGSA